MEKRKGCLVGVVVFLFVILIIIIAIISCSDDKKEPVPQADPAGDEIAEPPVDDTAALAAAALMLLEESYEGIATVEYDAGESSFNITPTDPDFVAASMAIMTGDAGALESWGGMVESLKGLSGSIAKTLPNHYLQLVNPSNPELSLLILLDGYVFYDFTDE